MLTAHTKLRLPNNLYQANLERLVEESYGKEKLEELQTEGKWKAVNMFA